MDKRYSVFAGDNHYPLGGTLDMRGHFHQIGDAKGWIQDNALTIDWAEIVDTKTMESMAYAKIVVKHEPNKTVIDFKWFDSATEASEDIWS